MPDRTPQKPNPPPFALEASEERFRLLVESVVDYAIFILDPTGIITTWNPGAERLKGYRAEEIIGKHFSVFYTPEDRERGHPAEVLASATEHGHHVEEGWRVRKDGTRFWASLALTALRTPDGSITGYAKVTRDLTERKLAEEELRQARDDLDRRVAERTAELAQRDREKDEFLAMLAHELRNPLAPILNASQVLQAHGPQDPILQRQRQVIERQARHMGRLLDDLLDVSRITRGKIELRRQPLDLREALTEAVEGLRARASECELELVLTLPQTPLVVEADPTRLNQVVGNLLSNAIKFTDPGGSVNVSLLEQDGCAIVEVTDTGMGIEPALLPRIFELFAQGDRSLGRVESGLGIGLTMVRRLVELHGAAVEAHSDGEGKGSRFTIRWPLAAQDRQAMPGTPAFPERLGELSDKLRVLIIDDNRDAADTLADLVSLWGYDVLTAYDGASALVSVERWKPDFVVLDIGMPGMDGFEVVRQLRALPGFLGVVTALTGYGQERDRERALSAGFDHHLTKPVDPDLLREILASRPGSCPAGTATA